jgi:hypothetical protein
MDRIVPENLAQDSQEAEGEAQQVSQPAPSPPGAPPPAAPAAGHVTREQLARAVGKDERTIRRWERTRLAPALSVDADGVHRFDLQRVSELLEIRERPAPTSPDAYDGEMAREAFRRFDDGLDPVSVVKETGFDPRAVRAMYTEWTSMRGGFFVPAEVAVKIASLSWLHGPNVSFHGNAQKLLECLEASRPLEQCRECEERPPQVCSACAHAISVHEAKRRATEARVAEERKKQEKEQAQLMRSLRNNLHRKGARGSGGPGSAGGPPGRQE